MSQDKHLTVTVYLDRFQNSVKVIEHCGGTIGLNPGLVGATIRSATPVMTRDTATAEQLLAAEKYTKEQYLACAFLMGLDGHQYGKLIEDLENDFTQRPRANYPKTPVDAYNLLVHWKQDPRNLTRVLGTNNDGVAFANVGADEASSLSTLTSTDNRHIRGRRDTSHITCHKCGIKGHASTCPKLEQESDVEMLMAGMEDSAFNEATSFQFLLTGEDQEISLHQQQNGRVPASWILHNNRSTVNVFSNKELLTNIRATDRVMNI
jgi:hypothetical protein